MYLRPPRSVHAGAGRAASRRPPNAGNIAPLKGHLNGKPWTERLDTVALACSLPRQQWKRGHTSSLPCCLLSSGGGPPPPALIWSVVPGNRSCRLCASIRRFGRSTAFYRPAVGSSSCCWLAAAVARSSGGGRGRENFAARRCMACVPVGIGTETCVILILAGHPLAAVGNQGSQKFLRATTKARTAAAEAKLKGLSQQQLQRLY